MKGPYISLETKAKMKERTRLSPDLADSAVVLVKMFRERDRLAPSRSSYPTAHQETPWKKFQRKRALETVYDRAPTY